jgi:hypothetical protein
MSNNNSSKESDPGALDIDKASIEAYDLGRHRRLAGKIEARRNLAESNLFEISKRMEYLEEETDEIEKRRLIRGIKHCVEKYNYHIEELNSITMPEIEFDD